MRIEHKKGQKELGSSDSSPLRSRFERSEGFKLALREVIAEQFQPALANDSNEVWNHDIAVTQKPPDENILDIAGKQGYQLVNVIYDSEQNVWMSYFKKRINV